MKPTDRSSTVPGDSCDPKPNLQRTENLRLAEALRQNLMRRKDQRRAREDAKEVESMAVGCRDEET